MVKASFLRCRGETGCDTYPSIFAPPTVLDCVFSDFVVLLPGSCRGLQAPGKSTSHSAHQLFGVRIAMPRTRNRHSSASNESSDGDVENSALYD